MHHSWLKLFFMASYLGYQIHIKLQGLENCKSFSYYFLNEKCPINIFAKTDNLMHFLARICFLLFLLFLKFKIILWNASCQEKINLFVSNISCFSVCKPGTHRLFILYNLEKRYGLFFLGLGSHSLGLILKLPPLTLKYLVRWNFRRTRCYYGTAMQPIVTSKFLFCAWLKISLL